mmetsp:Transcript_11343/g.13705  ORF Transcript_11343/g.13705 Transcript_11343/m.13705 type:complete len:229 (+) Transcript_11343:27-713(+)|eukprot:CAMPEP_0195259110 /NCGR_PEP_ID=MMETSP0706-20130129/7763_1 /TAXON_ID=33640 /ORGANISM="Asterionellopsis glacialis, Strain CCMP134" /LENGTH=228 /DNA_ID=CAMNT_0040312535 /DNA_START=51 /DNA_END=737 /DNA_ORIENTATION=+
MTNARDSPSKAPKGGSSSKNNNNNKGGDNAVALSVKFPVNTVVELTLSPTRESVQGMVYCTDEVTNTIVLKKSLTHTTLASEIRMINASSVAENKVIQAAAEGGGEHDVLEGDTDTASSELPLPFQTTSRKAIEEREKRAIRSAEDSFRHINQKASPEGQAVFDRLLKACNEVVWRGESILVLGEVKVDPPYGKDNCKLVRSDHGSGSLNEGSLERVRNIVGATSSKS